MSELVDHARREMTLIGEDPELIENICEMLSVFTKFNHDGASAAVAIPMINQLLEAKNLSPLTNDPDEWEYHEPEIFNDTVGVWQNRRNAEAFSTDGGKTFYLLGESMVDGPLHVSVPMKPKAVQ